MVRLSHFNRTGNWKRGTSQKLAGEVGEEAERMIGLLNEAIIRAGSGLMRMIWG